MEAYNALIAKISSRQRNFDAGKSRLIDILEEMSQNGIAPDEQTIYNSITYVYNLVAKSKESIFVLEGQKTALSLLSEFRNFGIEPSLGTYEYIIKIYNLASTTGKSHAIIFDVIEELEKKQNSGASLKIVIQEDVHFFYQAMQWINKINNVKLAYRLHRLLLNEGEHCNSLLGGMVYENYYYK